MCLERNGQSPGSRGRSDRPDSALGQQCGSDWGLWLSRPPGSRRDYTHWAGFSVCHCEIGWVWRRGDYGRKQCSTMYLEVMSSGLCHGFLFFSSLTSNLEAAHQKLRPLQTWQCHFTFWKALPASSSKPEPPAGRSEKMENFSSGTVWERLSKLVSEHVGSAHSTAPSLLSVIGSML